MLDIVGPLLQRIFRSGNRQVISDIQSAASRNHVIAEALNRGCGNGEEQVSDHSPVAADDDYVEGTASSIANELSLATGKKVHTLGLDERTAGFHPSVDSLPPTAEKIMKKLKQIKHG